MKWAEFKKYVESKGVKDEDKLAYIDLWHFFNISVEKTDDGWAIMFDAFGDE